MHPNIYLTKDEHKALVLLSEGKTSFMIREQCLVPASGMSFFLSEIRRKTGIRDTKQPPECREYLKRHNEALSHSPAPEHIRLLQKYQAGETWEGIAYTMPLPIEEVLPALDKACHAIGSFTRDERARKMQVRQYLACYLPNETVIWAPNVLAVLHGIANATPIEEIAAEVNQLPGWVRSTAKDTLYKLGLAARGRDVQKTMAASFLRVREYLNPTVTMDDPAF